MFSKNTEKLESFVGMNSHFKGDVKSKGTLRIDGTLEGNVEADWLVLGEKANLRGDAAARGIIVGGRIEGNVTAREILEIRSKGQVLGDITVAKLVVSEGGMLVGRTSMNREDSNVVELPVKERSGY
ncbi:MAG TPA: polymer-forming cytoskeletal protein [Thermodesulfovibrionales bacterium]|nr:polymer-forming cytoskeletal protein [Thermodesulfovibrionales bacterium]